MINLLAHEAQLIQTIHHGQEIDKLSMGDMSEGHQFWFSTKGIMHYFTRLIIITFFPRSFVCTELVAYMKARRKGSVSTGSQCTREVHLEAKCCLMVSSWCTSSQSIRGGSGEHLSWIHRRFVPPQSPCQSDMFWHSTDILPVVPQATSEDSLQHRFEVDVWASVHVSVCVYRKTKMTAHLFLAQYTGCCGCVAAALCPGQAARSSTMECTGIALAVLSDPHPLAPTSAGAAYKNPGW